MKMRSEHPLNPNTDISRRMTAWLQWLPALIVGVLLALTSSTSAAVADGDAEFRFSSREVWVGQPFLIEVDVVNAATWEDPVVPKIDGVTSEVMPSARESTFTQIINGVATTRSTRTFVIRMIANKSGIIEIPSISVIVDGRRIESRTWRVIASKSEVGDLLIVEIIGTPAKAWVGQPVQLTLQIWIEQFVDRERNVRLDEADMWGLLSAADSSWGVFKEPLEELSRNRRRPSGRRVERGDRTYFLYEIKYVDHPVRAGAIDPGEVRILLRQPTGLVVQRDIFNRRQVAVEGFRPVIQTAEIRPIEVRPLPEEGRPATFTGAVGRFTVRASAEPREVSVGDPITLRYEVIEDPDAIPGDLANLRPPPLRDLEALADFRVPDDPTTGVVDGRAKTFTETLRPERDDITAIPAIPFVSFDPETGRYVTASSEPIRITVKASERLDLGAVVRNEGENETPLRRTTSLTATTGGLRANLPVTDAVMAHHRIDGDWTTIVALLGGPTVFLVGLVAIRRREFRAANPEHGRATGARRRAIRTLDEEGTMADRVHDAICGLIAARLHLPDGTLTAQEADRAVAAAGLAEDRREELRTVLRAAEAGRYAPASADQDELRSRAEALLPELDRLRPNSKTKGGEA
ncbi:MAG: hypothetical protein CBB69_000605 [Phycisphaera sp. TMED9]|nr:MAG: hypothetical protein CBB69_000605 [Phycisphaera sp. TMED9]